MDAAEVWLKILKMVPYVVLAGLAGVAALLTFQRSPGLREASPSGSMPLDDGGWDAQAPRGGGWREELLRPWAPLARRALARWGLRVVLPVLLALAVIVPAGRLLLQPPQAQPESSPGRALADERRAVAAATPQMRATAQRGATAADGGLKFGELAAAPPGGQGAGPDSDPSGAAWLFGALISGGRSAEAWALLTPEAQRETSRSNFDGLLGSAYLLRGSDDAPWRVPGSNTFLFSVSQRGKPSALEGELRVGLAVQDGQWRVASFQLHRREVAGAGSGGVGGR